MIRFDNRIIPKNEEKDDEGDDKDINKVIKNSDLVYNSPSVFLKKNKSKKPSLFSLNSPSPAISPLTSQKR